MENLIDRYIKERNEKTRQDRAGALHPSSLGKCQRAATFEFLGKEPTINHSIETLRAFQMGFLLFLPFLILDMVVASVLVSMGMMMLPPVLISLPFKLVLFVLADGWNVLMGSLIESFR